MKKSEQPTSKAKQTPDRLSRIAKPIRSSAGPHEQLFHAIAIVECMRLITLNCDLHEIPYLTLSDACEATKDLIEGALGSIGDDNV